MNHTNQTMLKFLFSWQQTPSNQRSDLKVRTKSFFGLPTEDVLTWLDQFDNVTSYHSWPTERKLMEVPMLVDGVAATWFIQQEDPTKVDWPTIEEKLIEIFANQDVNAQPYISFNTCVNKRISRLHNLALK